MTSLRASGRASQAYPWCEPTSVKSDGKYRVTADGQIRLVHMIDRRERALLTTNQHPQLVETVQAVKREHGDPPSGVFYINEWRHVLVKAGGGTWFAGRYDRLLEFDLDGQAISALAPVDLAPGDEWRGPRVGIRYTLAAAGDDVYCRRIVRPGRERDEYLSDFVPGASSLVRCWSSLRPHGGRIYINEARELFTPAREGATWTYVGRASLDQRFPEPQVE